MIIETKNSSYQIQGSWIRKLNNFDSGGHNIGRDWMMFNHLYFVPRVGEYLIICWDSYFVKTSPIVAIVTESQDEKEYGSSKRQSM